MEKTATGSCSDLRSHFDTMMRGFHLLCKRGNLKPHHTCVVREEREHLSPFPTQSLDLDVFKPDVCANLCSCSFHSGSWDLGVMWHDKKIPCKASVHQPTHRKAKEGCVLQSPAVETVMWENSVLAQEKASPALPSISAPTLCRRR